MPAVVTLTGKAGPGGSVTAKPFDNVNDLLIETNKGLITLYRPGETIQPIDINAATTVVATKTGTNWAITIS